MSTPIPLFKLTPLTWDVTSPWQFTDPYGEPYTQDLTDRKWLLDCDHEPDECDLSNSASCGTPIGYRLVQECLGASGQ